jgi:serine/threonine protein kinase
MQTLEWMAPEIVEGGVYTTAADVYSIGIVVWECLTQQLPYVTPEGDCHPRTWLTRLLKDGLLPCCEQLVPAMQHVLQGVWERDPRARAPLGALLTALEAHMKAQVTDSRLGTRVLASRVSLHATSSESGVVTMEVGTSRNRDCW